MECIAAHEWPGNIRELRNLVEAAFVHRRQRDKVLRLPPQFKLRRARSCEDDAERAVILTALHAAEWNKSKAAAQLRWSRMTLYRKLNRLKIACE